MQKEKIPVWPSSYNKKILDGDLVKEFIYSDDAEDLLPHSYLTLDDFLAEVRNRLTSKYILDRAKDFSYLVYKYESFYGEDYRDQIHIIGVRPQTEQEKDQFRKDKVAIAKRKREEKEKQEAAERAVYERLKKKFDAV